MIALQWISEHRFSVENPTGARLTLDSDSKEGLSPTQALLASLGGCMAVDVILILNKMRAGLEALRVTVEGDRMEEPPRYFRRVRLRFDVEGSVSREQAERAVKLSFEKYCSVFHSLRKDLEVETEITVSPATP